MKKNKFSTPLLQSAAVLIVSLIFFGFVVASENHTLLGSLWAIISGIFYTIVYAIGLTIGVAFCITFLVVLFIAVLYLVSQEQAKTMWLHIKERLLKCQNYIEEYLNNSGARSCVNNLYKPASTEQSEKIDSLQRTVAELETQIEALKQSEKRNTEILNKLSAER